MTRAGPVGPPFVYFDHLYFDHLYFDYLYFDYLYSEYFEPEDLMALRSVTRQLPRHRQSLSLK
jgi:hypothetical protein